MSHAFIDSVEADGRSPLTTRRRSNPKFDKERFAELVEEQLQTIGEDSSRDGLTKTPDRVAKAFDELTRGYRQDPRTLVTGALFDGSLMKW
jgi:GTP cyclohydrolase I